MPVLDLTCYAAPVGAAALGIAYLLYRLGLAAAGKNPAFPEVFRNLSAPGQICSRRIFSTAALFIGGIFFAVLLFLETGLSSISFLAGTFSTALLILFAHRVLNLTGPWIFGDQPKPGLLKAAGPFFGNSLIGLAVSGAALTGVGLFFYTFTWEDPLVVGSFALGTALVLFFAVNGGAGRTKKAGDSPWMAADLYVSYACLLAAGVALGAAMDGHQRVWTGMPLLFAMTGIAASLLVLPLAMVGGEKARRWLQDPTVLSGLVCVAGVYVLVRSLTRKFSAGDIAYAGMLDRLGPFWAMLAGWVTGLLLREIAGYCTSRRLAGWSGWAAVAALVYFILMGAWIAYLFAGPYGWAMAGIGMLGPSMMVLTFTDVKKSDNTREADMAAPPGREPETLSPARGFNFGVSVFAALAISSAYFAAGGGEADPGSLMMLDFSDIPVLCGLLAGWATPFFLIFLEGRFFTVPAAGISADCAPDLIGVLILAAVVLFIPFAVGMTFGPDVLGGFLFGTVLGGISSGFTAAGQSLRERSAGPAVYMKLIPLVALVFAPLIQQLYEAMH